MKAHRQQTAWRKKLYEVIYEADTRAGKIFDISLLIAILLSLAVVAWESIPGLDNTLHDALYYAEWVLTVLFSLEYVARLLAVRQPIRYATSFYGIIDLMAVLPTYLSILFPGLQYMMVWRSLRLLRIFRVLKLVPFLNEAGVLVNALVQSRRKILIFFTSLVIYVLIFGTLMYVVEGPENGFTSIPVGIYWAVVTMTTTGFGDVVPHTALGQTLASLVMLVGYSIIAVPTGIVSVEIARAMRTESAPTRICPSCLKEGHDEDAVYCKFCGSAL